MNAKFPDMSVKLNSKLRNIKLTGTQRQVNEAKSMVQSILAGMIMKSKTYEPIMLTLFSKKEKYFADMIKGSGE